MPERRKLLSAESSVADQARARREIVRVRVPSEYDEDQAKVQGPKPQSKRPRKQALPTVSADDEDYLVSVFLMLDNRDPHPGMVAQLLEFGQAAAARGETARAQMLWSRAHALSLETGGALRSELEALLRKN